MTTTTTSSSRIAVYAGSFDPLTNGHLDLIRRGARVFDTLHVAVGNNPRKRYLFSVKERTDMLRESLDPFPNVVVGAFSGLLVDHCLELGASVILRGLRAVADFEYEFQMGLANRALEPELETVFLLTAAETIFVSSSIVKEIISGGRPVDAYVPHHVARALQAKIADGAI